MELLHYLLLILCSTSVIASEDTCLLSYDFDVFRFHTSISKQEIIKNLVLNEAPRLHNHNREEPAYDFSGGEHLKISDKDVINAIQNTVCSRHAVTLYSSLFFNNQSFGGPIIELAYKNDPILGLYVDRRSNEILVTYRHEGLLRVEKFDYTFKTAQWYKLVVVLTGNLMVLNVNCVEVDYRLVPIPDYCVLQNETCLLVGKGSVETRTRLGEFYSGSLQTVGLSGGDIGLKKLCPENENFTCPVCGEFLTTLKQLGVVSNKVKILEEELAECKALNTTLTNVTGENPTAPVHKCLINEISYPDNSFAKKDENTVCYCRDGNAICENIDNIQIPPPPITIVTSTPPTTKPSETTNVQTCAPRVINGDSVVLPVGEWHTYNNDMNQCVVTICEFSEIFGAELADPDNRDCVAIQDCSAITDELERDVAMCCGTCDSCDFITCPDLSTCVSNECVCIDGYERTMDLSLVCQDRDECALGRQQGGHSCPTDSVCVNLNGSYTCNCGEGYEIARKPNGILECQNIDECATDQFDCPETSHCTDTDGGYECTCDDNYQVVNGDCAPICTSPCLNGGTCTNPGECSCLPGFTGDNCESDINECETDSLHDCHHYNIAECVNTHGGYFCRCADGFHRNASNGKCDSVLECKTGLHDCPLDRYCREGRAAYRCECDGSDCRGWCVVDGELIPDNNIEIKNCDVCTCKSGVYGCQRMECDCSDEKVSQDCCPQCFKKDVCYDVVPPLKLGARVIDKCSVKKCVTGENGEVELQVQDISSQCTNLTYCPKEYQYTPEGACCPVCELPKCEHAIVDEVILTMNGCNECTCKSLNWSYIWECMETNACNEDGCPSLQTCPKSSIIHFPESDCPMCLNTLFNELTCSES